MLVDLIHARACKPFCEKSLTLPAYYLLTSLGLTVNQGYNIYGVTITIVCLIVLKPIIQFINNYFGMFLGKLPFKAKNDVDCHQTLP